jgi:hypothetical protein
MNAMQRLMPLLVVALLVGCGSDDPQTAGTPSAPPEPPPAETGPPAEPIPTEPAPQKGLPPAVEETRDAIIRAAGAHDYEGLAALIPDSGFTFSYGAGTSAIDYWKDLEAAGETPLATMAALLALRHTRAQDIYVWPWAYDKDPSTLTDAEKDALAGAGAATRGQLDQMADLGHYLGWRLGIRRDGTWMFFVAGD